MSKTIDEKVVEMRFDNGNFEKNVSKSLHTLDSLKFKLNTLDFRGTSDNITNLAKNIKNIDMSPLTRGIETVQAKFSALQVIGVTALANLTNSAINAGKNMVYTMTNSIIQGGRNRAQKIKDAKFQMEGLLGTEEYKKQWDRIDESINYAVKDTAYGYDSAARAASQFLASNVKVGEEMDRSLRAISGVAAMTNSSYDDISNIFTRISGQGRIMANDLNSLAARGLNAAAILGKSMNKSESEIRDMTSKGKISFNDFAKAMDDAFGAHAKKGNETFTGSLENMKAAMSRIGAKIWDPLLDNQRDVFNQVRLLMNDLNNNYLNGPISKLNASLTETYQRLVKFFELGGVKNIVLGLGDILEYFASIIRPIKDTFREMFPKKSVESLVEYTAKFKDFTSKLKLSDDAVNSIKNTFRGLFSIVDLCITTIKKIVKEIINVLSNLTGIPNTIVGITGAIGTWVSTNVKLIKNSNILNNTIEKISKTLTFFIEKIKTVIDYIKSIGVFKHLLNGVKIVFGFLSSAIKTLGEMLRTALRSGDIKAALDVFNSSVFGMILLNVSNITKSLDLFFRKIEKYKSVGNISLWISSVKDALYALQFDIKADAIMRIAKAVAILAASLFVLSLVKPERIITSLGGLAVLIKEIMWSFKLLSKFTDMKLIQIVKLEGLVFALKSFARSLLVLSVALKILSTISWDRIKTSLAAMGGALAELLGTVAILSLMSNSKYFGSPNTGSLFILSLSLVVLAGALKILATMSWDDIKRSLSAMGGALGELVVAIGVLSLISKFKHTKLMKSALSILVVGNAMILIAGVLKILATMSWDDIKRSLTAMGGALGELVVAIGVLSLISKFKHTKLMKSALSILVVSNAMILIAGVLKILATMSWDDIKRSLSAMGGALGELVVAIGILAIISKVGGSILKSALAILIVSNAMIVLAGAMKIFGSLSIGQVVVGLLAMAGALAVITGAAILMEPIFPALIKLSAIIAIIGGSVFLAGAGLLAFSAGLASLVATISASGTIIISGLESFITAIIMFIPDLIAAIGKGIVLVCKTIIEAAPTIARTLLSLLVESLKAIYDFLPQIIDLSFNILLTVIKSLKEKGPLLVTDFVDLLAVIFGALKTAINNINPDLLSNMIKSMAGLSALVFVLSKITPMIPGAMIGVLGLGVIIAEFGLVLAAFGGLAQIPGIKWIIEEGGNFLQIIGTSLGKFIGGFAGGVGVGITSQMPTMAKNLTSFADEFSKFAEKISSIPDNTVDKVKAITATILYLSGAELINAITSLKSGFFEKIQDIFSNDDQNINGFGRMGKQLSEFADQIQPFIESVSKIDPQAVESVKALAESILYLTSSNFIDQISSTFFGNDNSINTFATQMEALGGGLKSFSDSISGMSDSDISSVKSAVECIKTLSEAASLIPNEGGFISKIVGDNKVGDFGKQLGDLGYGILSFYYAVDEQSGINIDVVRSACEVLKLLAEVEQTIPNAGGLLSLLVGDNTFEKFAKGLPNIGEAVKGFSDAVSGGNAIDEASVTAATGLIKSLAELGSDDLSKLSSSVEEFGARLISFANKLNEFLGSMGLISEDNLKSAIDKISKIKDISSEASQIDSASIENFANSLKDLGDKGVDNFVLSLSGDEALNEARQAVNDLINAVVDSAGTMADTIKSKFNEVGSNAYEGLNYDQGRGNWRYFSFESLGRNFVEGFAAGITNNIGIATNAGSLLGSRALQAAKESIDAHSPSRETYKLGTFFDLGFINGIKSLSNNVYNESSSLGDQARDGLYNAIERISSIIDGGISDDIVISPILDLSDVESGANRIGSLLSGQNYSISSNLGAIASNVNYRNQNRVNNSDVLSAINKLGDNLGNIRGDTYNVNGITYDDGSNITQAVQTLIRAAKVERRT